MATLDQMIELTYKIRLARARGLDDNPKHMDEYDEICRELNICDVLGCTNPAPDYSWCEEHRPYADEDD